MRSVIGLILVGLTACGSSESSDAKSDGGGKTSDTSAAAGGTPTCKMTVAGDSKDSEPYVVEAEGSPTGLLGSPTNADWAVVNDPKANGIIGCFHSETNDAGRTTQVHWLANMDQPGPLKPYKISSDTAKLTSEGYTPVDISFSTFGADYSCAVSAPVCSGGGSDCKPLVLGTFNFDVTYAKASPLQPGNSMGWLIKGTGHAECPGGDNGMVTIDVVFDLK